METAVHITNHKRFIVREVMYKYRTLENVPDKFKNLTITGPNDVVDAFHDLFEGSCKEKFYVVWLNAKNGVMGWECISVGNLNATVVSPREIFSLAVKYRVGLIIIMHNHPSGEPEPSSEDKLITKQLVESGKILGIPVHDHIIFTDSKSKYTSFAERGLL